MNWGKECCVYNKKGKYKLSTTTKFISVLFLVT